MNWEQVVELHASGAPGSHGSGYLIAPGLVLTAGHILAGCEEVDLRFLLPDEDKLPGDAGPWQSARVVWRGQDSDLALVAPKESTFRGGPAIVAIARLDGRSAVRVDALGFPRAMFDRNRSDTLHVEGLVNPWTGVRGAPLMVDVQTACPAEGALWKGMSGAALFAADRLVGVIRRVPGKFDKTLAATPAHTIVNDDHAARLLKEAGVDLAPQLVDSAYVDSMPRTGHWGGLRETYTRAVVSTLCRIDHVGLAVGGIPDSKTPALAVFTGWRLKSDLSELGRCLQSRLTRARSNTGFL